MSRSSYRILLSLAFTQIFLFASFSAFCDSQARIVRLSYIEGGVQIDRHTGQGYEKAMVNFPIVQGEKLRTMEGGRGEVEFEDGSTIRIAPNSIIQFSQLALRDSGDKVSAVELNQGTLYVDYANAKNQEFTVLFGREKLALAHSSHLRVILEDSDAAVAVFKGDIQIQSPSATIEVKKNQTANIDLDEDSYKLTKNVQEEPLDAWDKQQDQYHVRYASNSYNSYSPYAYGVSDLGYYGNFFNVPGYGMMWQPYLVGAGWDPFMDGAWAFSPGWGFGWVSAYPWGWTPYHYGTWVFVPAYGWAWQPGGVWTPWYVQPRVLNAPQGFSVPKAPTTGTSTAVVNRGPAFTDHSGNKLVIRNNSAGLGVPRGEVNNLAKVSQQAQVRGTVTEHVHSAPMTPPSSASMSGGGRESAGPSPRASQPTYHESAPAPSHSGSAPPPPHR